MREAFEDRMMELMQKRTRNFGHFTNVQDDFIEPWEAIECMRQALNEFEATIYQP